MNGTKYFPESINHNLYNNDTSHKYLNTLREISRSEPITVFPLPIHTHNSTPINASYKNKLF